MILTQSDLIALEVKKEREPRVPRRSGEDPIKYWSQFADQVEGMTRDEAAEHLQCAKTTISKFEKLGIFKTHKKARPWEHIKTRARRDWKRYKMIAPFMTKKQFHDYTNIPYSSLATAERTADIKFKRETPGTYKRRLA